MQYLASAELPRGVKRHTQKRRVFRNAYAVQVFTSARPLGEQVLDSLRWRVFVAKLSLVVNITSCLAVSP